MMDKETSPDSSSEKNVCISPLRVSPAKATSVRSTEKSKKTPRRKLFPIVSPDSSPENSPKVWRKRSKVPPSCTITRPLSRNDDDAAAEDSKNGQPEPANPEGALPNRYEFSGNSNAKHSRQTDKEDNIELLDIINYTQEHYNQIMNSKKDGASRSHDMIDESSQAKSPRLMSDSRFSPKNEKAGNSVSPAKRRTPPTKSPRLMCNSRLNPENEIAGNSASPTKRRRPPTKSPRLMSNSRFSPENEIAGNSVSPTKRRRLPTNPTDEAQTSNIQDPMQESPGKRRKQKYKKGEKQTTLSELELRPYLEWLVRPSSPNTVATKKPVNLILLDVDLKKSSEGNIEVQKRNLDMPGTSSTEVPEKSDLGVFNMSLTMLESDPKLRGPIQQLLRMARSKNCFVDPEPTENSSNETNEVPTMTTENPTQHTVDDTMFRRPTTPGPSTSTSRRQTCPSQHPIQRTPKRYAPTPISSMDSGYQMNNVPMPAMDHPMHYNMQNVASGNLAGQKMTTTYADYSVPVSMRCPDPLQKPMQQPPITSGININSTVPVSAMGSSSTMNNMSMMSMEHQMQCNLPNPMSGNINTSMSGVLQDSIHQPPNMPVANFVAAPSTPLTNSSYQITNVPMAPMAPMAPMKHPMQYNMQDSTPMPDVATLALTSLNDSSNQMHNIPLQTVEYSMQYNVQEAVSGKLGGQAMTYTNDSVSVSMIHTSNQINNAGIVPIEHNIQNPTLSRSAGQETNMETPTHEPHPLQSPIQEHVDMSVASMAAAALASLNDSMNQMQNHSMTTTEHPVQYKIQETTSGKLGGQGMTYVPVSMMCSSGKTNNVQTANLQDNINNNTSRVPAGKGMNMETSTHEPYLLQNPIQQAPSTSTSDIVASALDSLNESCNQMLNVPMKTMETEMQYNIQDSTSGKLGGKGMAYSNATVPVSIMCSSGNMNNMQTAKMHHNTNNGAFRVPDGKGMNTGTSIHQEHQLQNLTQQPQSMSTSDVGASMQDIITEIRSDTLANQMTISDVNSGVPVSMMSSSNQTNNVQMPAIGYIDSNNQIYNMEFATSGEPLGDDMDISMLEPNLECDLEPNQDFEERLSTISQNDNEALALPSTNASGNQTQNVPMATTETPEQYPSTVTSGNPADQGTTTANTNDEIPVLVMDTSNDRNNVVMTADEDSVESDISEESGEERMAIQRPQRSYSPDIYSDILCSMMDYINPKSMWRTETYIRKTMSALLTEEELIDSISMITTDSLESLSQQLLSRFSSDLDGEFLCSMMDCISPKNKKRAEYYIRKMMIERPFKEGAKANMTMVGSDPSWLEWLQAYFDDLI